nr:8873_t:CDS:10 [Entrophospora candida]
MSTEKLNVLLIGSGGREHSIAWKLAQSSRVEQIYVAPGNGGTEIGNNKIFNVNIDISDFANLTKFSLEKNINLVVPGPEQCFFLGLVGIPCFGPSTKASMMEGSKTFAKDFMEKHKIPTAAYKNFSNYEKAKDYLESISHNIVIKASGLAGGKGVLIPTNKEDALNALKVIMVDRIFGSAGDEIVIEEFLDGEELSILTFSDGYTIVSLPPAQDHKRIFDGDQGPNTGGMGCYCPAPIATPELLQQINSTILQPTIDGLRHDGYPFVGMLFTGLMVTGDGPKVLEYNVRFGDPETETVLPLLSDDTDLAEIMMACIERRLDSIKINIKPGHSATVIIASGGYPGSYAKGKEITFQNLQSDTLIFHAGTIRKNNKLVTSGGRVLAVTGIASTLRDAVDKAYKDLKNINFENMYYRKDIAHRAFKHISNNPSANSEEVMTYASAGVSIDSGNLLVQKIKSLVKKTERVGSNCELGGFGGLFDLKATGFKDPILIATTDGVGTKLKIAQETRIHNTIGAEPLFLLDYYACGKLNVDVAKNVVEGIANGCHESGCALIGGETSEMPGIYKDEEYDLAGFAVGAVEREDLLPRVSDIKVNDILIGLASSGIHSNGFSLIRKIITKKNLKYESTCPWDSKTSLGKSLLTPTKIYVKQLLPLIKNKKKLVKAMIHITGGGFVDNIPRVLPENLGVNINSKSWELPQVFKWLASNGNIPSDELYRTFNCGIGMVLIVSSENEGQVINQLQESDSDTKIYKIGHVIERQNNNEKRIIIEGI